MLLALQLPTGGSPSEHLSNKQEEKHLHHRGLILYNNNRCLIFPIAITWTWCWLMAIRQSIAGTGFEGIKSDYIHQLQRLDLYLIEGLYDPSSEIRHLKLQCHPQFFDKEKCGSIHLNHLNKITKCTAPDKTLHTILPANWNIDFCSLSATVNISCNVSV